MAIQKQTEDTLKASYQYGSSYANDSSRSAPLRTFLFGYPIAHSMAPLVHSKLFKGVSLPWTYTLLETQDASEFLPALRQKGVVGCAVTMPYKVAMMSVVDEVTEEGRIIGAINTVFLRKAADGSTKYIGTNTDCLGVREAFLQNFPDVISKSTGKPGLVIGGGGACRAAIYALWKWLGVSKVYLVNRLESEVKLVADSLTAAGFGGELVYVSSLEQAESLEAPALIVGTVPDFPPKEKGEILARRISEAFLAKESKGFVLEMCYHPKPKTEFYQLATKAGWNVLYGTESMIWQGVMQQVLWAEIPLDKFKMEETQQAVAEALEAHK